MPSGLGFFTNEDFEFEGTKREVFAKRVGPYWYRLKWKNCYPWENSSDDEIADYTGLKTNQITNTFIEEYNGSKSTNSNFTYFKNKKKALEAAEWVNSLMVAKELSKRV